MWSSTSLTRRLNISLPIIQAPMAGGATSAELVAAVSGAGALGSLGAGYLAPEAIDKAISDIRAKTDKPFGVNLFIPNQHAASAQQIQAAQAQVQRACAPLNYSVPLPAPHYVVDFEEQLACVVAAKVPVFSFTFGLLASEQLEQLKSSGALTIGTATTVIEGKALEASGVNMIVAQGCEAGGHRGTFIGDDESALIALDDLLSSIRAACKVPIIAAGGIMNGAGAAACLQHGAVAVQCGTAFLTCPESGVSSCYKRALLAAKNDNTCLTRAFSGKLARGINNTFIEAMQACSDSILTYPIQNALTSGMRKVAAAKGADAFMSLWAGQSLHLSQGLPAAQLLLQMQSDIEALMSAC